MKIGNGLAQRADTKQAPVEKSTPREHGAENTKDTKVPEIDTSRCHTYLHPLVHYEVKKQTKDTSTDKRITALQSLLNERVAALDAAMSVRSSLLEDKFGSFERPVDGLDDKTSQIVTYLEHMERTITRLATQAA